MGTPPDIEDRSRVNRSTPNDSGRSVSASRSTPNGPAVQRPSLAASRTVPVDPSGNASERTGSRPGATGAPVSESAAATAT